MNKYQYMRVYLQKQASYDVPAQDSYSAASAQRVAMDDTKQKIQAAGGSKGIGLGVGAGLLAGGVAAKLSKPFADKGSKFSFNPTKLNVRNASILGAGLYAGYKVNKAMRDKQRGARG